MGRGRGQMRSGAALFLALVFSLPAALAADGLDQRRLISSGSKYEALAGYSRAVVDGDWVFVSGTIGFDPETGDFADSVEDQTDQIFRNIEAALAQADAGLEHVVRVRVFVADRAYVMPVSRILGRKFADIRPTNTTLVTGMADPAAKVEIEVTALRRR